MVSRASRFLAVLYLIIISVVLLAEATLFYVIGLLPTALLKIIIILIAAPTYLSFFIFISGYTVSLALFPEAHVPDRLWLSMGLSISLLVIIPFFTRLFKLIFPSVTLLNTSWIILIISIGCVLVYIKRKTVKALRKELLGWLFAFLHRLNI